MSKKLTMSRLIAPVLALMAAVLLVVAVASPRSVGDTRTTAQKLEKRLERRMKLLDRLAMRPQAKLPADMVVYVYSDDTLRTWRGRFPLLNDDISSRLVMQRIVSPKANLDSPLSYVGDAPVFINMGPNWYLIRSRDDSGTRTVEGLQVSGIFAVNEGSRTNPRLHLGRSYSVRPLTASEGYPVSFGGKAVFKIQNDSSQGTPIADPALLGLALLLMLAAAVSFTFTGRTLTRALISCGVILVSTAAMYFWGRGVQTELHFFSPMLYAGGSFLYSLGAVLLVNAAILLCSLCLYLVRRDIWARVRPGVPAALWGAACVATVLGILVYTHLSFRSIILNSNIPLELYKLGSLTEYTLLVYVSFLSMLASVPMLLQMLQPLESRLFGRRLDMFSALPRALFAIGVAVWLVWSSAVLGFRKEENRVEVWAGRLAVDRDINLELQLLSAERRIAGDGVIAVLSSIEGSEGIIRNRIVDNYLFAASQECNISVVMLRPGDASGEQGERLRTVLLEGQEIADGSVFLCTRTSEGPSRYDGVFRFMSEEGIVHMIVGVEQKSVLSGKGYESLMSLRSSSGVMLPPYYSYSRYRGSSLMMFRGSFPYSTTMDDWLRLMVYTDGLRHFVRDGYVHFINVVAEDESVIISRPRIQAFTYVTAVLMIALLLYLMMFAFRPWKGWSKTEGVAYFRQRISLTLMVSLLLVMALLAGVSVVFVYRRNEANRKAIMSDRINSIQLLVRGGMKSLGDDPEVLRSQEFAAMIQSVSDNSGSDISVYGPEGRILLTTNPEVLDHLLLGYRIEAEALDQIMVSHKRYCILKQGTGMRHYYNMYMPLMDGEGRTLAILCVPYLEWSYDFERDAMMHLMTVLSVFLLLFILAVLMESAVLDRMFLPLSMIGKTMRRAGGGSLEHITYDQKDEVSTLVDAYNRMVDELAENERRLAQAERDKAWSGMARQVAHEIKNPLTPMKLQLQRLIRLKQKGDPSWQDKFDEVSGVLLDHIDILTETSNEFSTFARLYSEEHTEFDLDALLQEEVSMFDNREDVVFHYIGMDGVMVKGPKPQLTRVFVNLLGNAVQAVEGQEDAQVFVALRKSSSEGYYDVVVEDNGPGVSDENRDRLFTPNFTTKNGGSGLGLAICRSILESCGASISYSRSFSLGGACFTVKYPAE